MKSRKACNLSLIRIIGIAGSIMLCLLEETRHAK